jgi:hypothetical protein
MSHTPGPWIVVTGSGGWRVNATGHREVAATSHSAFSGSEDRNNARLIAAAPDLLEALERLLQSGDVRDAADAGALKQARAAIARVTGAEK